MSILNQHTDPFFDFLEQEYRRGKRMLSPWTTTDPQLLHLAEQYFPEVPLYPAHHFAKPNLTPVELLPLAHFNPPQWVDTKDYFVAVGGPPAAIVALQAAMAGKAVLYVCDNDLYAAPRLSLPIWSGAGNHGEPDSVSEAPAYILGDTPFQFIAREFFRFFNPIRNIKKITAPDYPWLSLNLLEWFQNPRQWLSGLRVAWGCHQLSRNYRKNAHADSASVMEITKKRVKASEHYLIQLHQTLGRFIRSPRGSLIVASSRKQLASIKKTADLLQQEGRTLLSLSPEEAKQKYGILPRGALALMEKTHDFIFEPDFFNILTKGIQAYGGEVISHWRLKKVFNNTQKQGGGILEFEEVNANQEKKLHYRKFQHAHLSLGATPFIPHIYDLISVTGVSMNALIIGAKLTGGPIVCGGSNHVIPLLPPQTIQQIDPATGKKQAVDISFVRLSGAGCVNPHDRGKNWYHYDARHALHLLHRVKATLPENAILKVLSVRGCNRVIGKDGRQVEFHPVITVNHKKFSCDSLTVQIGAGGGGLTQMGAVPQQMIDMES